MTGQPDHHSSKTDKARAELDITEADFYAARKETNACVHKLNKATAKEQAAYQEYLVALRVFKGINTGVNV